MVDKEKIRSEYIKFTKQLINKNISITTMESCTGGLISSLITDTEDSSAIFAGSLVTYSNNAKIMLGVPSETIKKYSVYSEETAKAMATAARNTFNAMVGIGITGTTGNIDPNNAEDSVPSAPRKKMNLFALNFHHKIPELTTNSLRPKKYLKN